MSKLSEFIELTEDMSATEVLKLGDMITPTNNSVEESSGLFHEMSTEEQDEALLHLDGIKRDLQTRPPLTDPR